MKRSVFTTFCLALAIFFITGISIVQALDVNAIFQQIKSELINKGLTSTDLAVIEQPTKSIISQGGSAADIKSMLLDFANNGLKGESLKNIVTLVSELMKKGESMKTAVTTVNQTLQTVKATGLKGDTLVAKVKELLSQHQEQVDQIKSAIGSKLSSFLK